MLQARKLLFQRYSLIRNGDTSAAALWVKYGDGRSLVRRKMALATIIKLCGRAVVPQEI